MLQKDAIYVDNAATSFPKPKQVIKAMEHYFYNIGANPGRGGYKNSIEAGSVVLETRKLLQNLFKTKHTEGVIFTLNITQAINIFLWSFLKPNDHVIITSMEHNAVVRPLREIEKNKNINISIARCNKNGLLDPNTVKKLITKQTKLIVMTHASNVTGSILPIEAVSQIANEHKITILVDTAQTAGILDIDAHSTGIDVIAFTGHKGLMGPQGIGGLVFDNIDLAHKLSPLICGGTGSKSESEHQPELLPDKFEAGTLNTIGIYGLNAALKFLQRVTIKSIYEKEKRLKALFVEKLKSMPNIKLHSPPNIDDSVGVVSISSDKYDMGLLSYELDKRYSIMTRSGLHCAPLAHKTIGTFPKGTLRFSFGYFNTEEDIDYCVYALKEILSS